MKWVVIYLRVVCSIHRLARRYSGEQNHSVPISKEYVHLFIHGFRNLCLFRCWRTPVFPNVGLFRLFLCSSDKSLGTHLAQTRLIQESSVRILKSEDLLTSLIDDVCLSWQCHECGISLYSHRSKAFRFFQRLLNRNLHPKIVFVTWRLVISIWFDTFLWSPSFVLFRWVLMTARCYMRSADVAYSGVF